ncbi:MAG: hypothetical protein ACE144_18495 [Thermodesulfobacteriota bacterium]
MDSNKTLGRFTFYSALSNLLPGVIFLWALPAIGPLRSGITLGSRLTGNLLIDLIVFLVLTYVLGLILQFLSELAMEPLLKNIFWKGNFFSNIFLIGAYRLCTKEELSSHIRFAENNLGFQKEDLLVLQDPEIITDEAKEKKAIQACRAIYHSLEAKTEQSLVGKRAHVQSTFYSFFLNLSASFSVVAAADLLSIPLKYMPLKEGTVVLILVNLALGAVFLTLARERGEQCVRGLFRSRST